MGRHRSATVVLVALIAVGLLAGCGTTPASAPLPATAARGGLSGGWGGPWTIGAYRGTVEADLVQRGSTLTGHGVVNGHPGVSRVSIWGVVRDDQASGTFSVSGLSATPFHVTITGNRMEGSLGQGRVVLERDLASLTPWRGPSRPPLRLPLASSPRVTRFRDRRRRQPSATVLS